MKAISLVLALALTGPAFAYELRDMSGADIRLMGKGLDKLTREETDDLYARIQRQLTEQDQAAAKAAAEKAAAEKAAFEKEIRQQVTKEQAVKAAAEKAAAESPESDQ